MFVICVNCHFNVTQNDIFCLNCGIENPTQSTLINDKSDTFGIIALITFIGGILGVVVKLVFDDTKLADNSLKELSPFFGIGLIIGLATSLLFELLIKNKLLKERKLKRNIKRNRQTLQSKEEEIGINKHEFRQDNLELMDLLENDSSLSNEDKQVLEIKIEIIDLESLICGMQQFEIDLLLQKNKILPFQQSINHLDLSEIENGFSFVKEILKNNEEIDDDETDDDSEEDPTLDKELADFRDRMDEILEEIENPVVKHSEELENAAQTLLDALTRRKESLLRGVVPTKESLIPFSDFSNLSLNDPNFKIDSVLTDFSASFNKLAIEFEKLDEKESIN